MDIMDFSLRKINAQIKRICFAERDNNAEARAEMQAELDALEMKRGEKLENIGYVRIEQKAYLKRLRAEKKRINREIKSVEADGAWLDWYCMMEMLEASMRKFKGKFLTLTVCASPTSAKVPMNPDTNKPRWDLIDPRFVGETVEPKLLTQEAIDHYNRTGEVAEGFRIIEDAEHLRVRLPRQEKEGNS